MSAQTDSRTGAAETAQTGDPTRKRKFTGSLRFKIALFYLILASVNILFFSAMIMETRFDFLLTNFSLTSRDLVRTTLDEMETLRIGAEEDDSFERLVTNLKARDAEEFLIFDAKGKVINGKVKTGSLPDSVPEDIVLRSKKLASGSEVMRERFDQQLREEDFSVQFILPLKDKNDQDIFLTTAISVKAITSNLRKLYWQVGLVVLWGVIFHVAFGVFVYRVIFQRVGFLRDVSNDMASGHLEARASWNMKRDDELDDLGHAFNQMAAKIQETVTTITDLNQQIQNELEIGKDVQELFLPRKNIFEDLNIAVYFRPMREVSGDVYKYYQYKSGHRALFFADATGHGVSAALVTTITIMSLDSVVRSELDSGHVVRRLSNILARRLESSYFATGFFVIINPDFTIDYTNAGHLNPYILRKETGEIEELPRHGPPLGMVEDFEFASAHVKMYPGDRLMIFSDGLTESKNADGEMFGEERVKQYLLTHSDKGTAGFVKDLSETLDRWTPKYDDDVSIIMLEIPGGE